MTKRSALKRQTREAAREFGVLDTPEFIQEAKVRRLPPNVGNGRGNQRQGWSPYPSNDDRDQAYLKTLKPKSDGQAELMEAIDAHNMVLALGPAGTGKTYLAVAKAVEAAASDVGAEVKVTGFVRFVLGEGIERTETDFAAEVAATVKG